MEKVHVDTINKVRADILRETGLTVETTDPIFTSVLAIQFSQTGAITKINEAAARLEKAIAQLEKVKISGGVVQSTSKEFSFGTLLTGMFLGALSLGSFLYMVH